METIIEMIKSNPIYIGFGVVVLLLLVIIIKLIKKANSNDEKYASAISDGLRYGSSKAGKEMSDRRWHKK